MLKGDIFMLPVRLKDLECNDEKKINKFLEAAKTGFLGLTDGMMPYVIPLNFVWMNESIYFHGASEGRKITCMEKNSNVCFTVSENLGTMTHPVPAKTDTAYMSVIIFGKAEKVVSLDESVEAMQLMLNKYVPGYYDTPLSSTHLEKYRSSLGSKTAVFKIKAEHVSSKENPVQLEKLFYSGKKVHHDSSN